MVKPTSLLRLALLLVLALVAVQPLLDFLPIARGSSPLMHLGRPYGFTEREVGDLTGRHFIVTGANVGIGLGTARMLARHNATVVMACRSTSKCEEARKDIVGRYKLSHPERVVCMKLDLSSLKDVKRFAEEYKRSGRPLHSLILNAGVMYPPHTLTEDGLELTFGVNHVAHFLLTRELHDLLRSSQPSSIVSVASNGHYLVHSGPAPLDDINTFNPKENYDIVGHYGKSKLANVLFAREFARRFPLTPSNQVLITSLNPGGVHTELYRHLTMGLAPLEAVMELLMLTLFWSIDQSALTLLGAALTRRPEHHGAYFVPVFREDAGSLDSRNVTLAKLWWDQTEDVLKKRGFM